MFCCMQPGWQAPLQCGGRPWLTMPWLGRDPGLMFPGPSPRPVAGMACSIGDPLNNMGLQPGKPPYNSCPDPCKQTTVRAPRKINAILIQNLYKGPAGQIVFQQILNGLYRLESNYQQFVGSQQQSSGDCVDLGPSGLVTDISAGTLRLQHLAGSADMSGGYYANY